MHGLCPLRHGLIIGNEISLNAHNQPELLREFWSNIYTHIRGSREGTCEIKIPVIRAHELGLYLMAHTTVCKFSVLAVTKVVCEY